MKEALILPAGSDLVEFIAQELISAGPPYTKTRVVLPGMRPGRFLLKRMAAAIGAAFAPPRLYSVESLTDELYRNLPGHRESDLDPLDAVALLRTLFGRIQAGIGGNHFRDPHAFLPLGLKLYSELEEIRFADAAPERLLETARSFPLREAGLLAGLYAPFYDSVARRGASTAATRAAAVAAADAVSHKDAGEKIIVAGISGVTALHARVFDALLSRNGLLLLRDGPGIEQLCEKLRAQPRRQSQASDGRAPVFSFTASPDLHGQVFAAAGFLRDRLKDGRIPDDRTLVLLPNADLLSPALQQLVPALEGHPVNISLGRQLTRTPLFAFLEGLLGVIRTRRDGVLTASSYLGFVMHPYTKGIRCGARADVTRILFQTLEKEFFLDRRRTHFRLEDLEREDDAIGKALARLPSEAGITDASQLQAHLSSIHGDTIDRFDSITDLASFASAVGGVIIAIADRGTARLHPDFHAHAVRILDILRRIENSGLRSVRLGNMEEYCSFFRSCVSGEVHHLPGTPVSGMQVLGVSEARCLNFDLVLVLNAVDDALPGGPGAPPLLPNAAREKLGVPTRRDAETETAYILHQLFAGASEIHFHYTEGEGKERSRFVEAALWSSEKAGNAPVKRFSAPGVRLANSLPEAIGKTPELLEIIRDFRHTATSLDDYLACPRRFCYKHVLRLHERRLPPDETGHADVGIFVHSALQRFHADHVGREDDLRRMLSDADVERMRELVEDLFEEQFADSRGAAFLVRRQLRQRLSEYVSDYLLPLANAQCVRIQATEVLLEADCNGAVIRGKIDRIDERDGDIVIIDYKTGGEPASARIKMDQLDADDPVSWRKAISSLQLPLYSLLYRRNADVEPERLRPMLLLLGAREIGAGIEAPMLFEKDRPGEVFDATDRVISAIVDEINNPSIPFHPPQAVGNRPSDACIYCPYRVMCGAQWLKLR